LGHRRRLLAEPSPDRPRAPPPRRRHLRGHHGRCRALDRDARDRVRPQRPGRIGRAAHAGRRRGPRGRRRSVRLRPRRPRPRAGHQRAPPRLPRRRRPPRPQSGPPAPAVAALAAAEALWAKEERLRSSIYATVQNILRGYADQAVADAAAGCDIDLDRWLAGPNTIYIVAPEHDQARLRPVLTVLLASAVRAAYDRANRHGGRLPRPLLALLDEAGN